MGKQFKWVATGALALAIAALPLIASAQNSNRPERINGRPNLNGIWQAMGSAHWNLEDHPASAGPSNW